MARLPLSDTRPEQREIRLRRAAHTRPHPSNHHRSLLLLPAQCAKYAGRYLALEWGDLGFTMFQISPLQQYVILFYKAKICQGWSHML